MRQHREQNIHGLYQTNNMVTTLMPHSPAIIPRPFLSLAPKSSAQKRKKKKVLTSCAKTCAHWSKTNT